MNIETYISNTQYASVVMREGNGALIAGDVVFFKNDATPYEYRGPINRKNEESNPWFKPVDGTKGFTVPLPVLANLPVEAVFRERQPFYVSAIVTQMHTFENSMRVFSMEEAHERLRGTKGLVEYRILSPLAKDAPGEGTE